MINQIMIKEITTTEKVQEKGSSLYILLRKEIAEELNISKNDLIELKIKKLEEKKKES